MKIDIEDLKVYLECPVKYYISKQRGIPPTFQEDFEHSVRKTIMYYYYNRMQGTELGIDKLKDKWGELWYKSKSMNEVMFRDEHVMRDVKREMELRGLKMIVDFYEHKRNRECAPVLVNMEYVVPIDKHILTGKFELVRANKDKQIEIVSFKTGIKQPGLFVSANDISLTGQVCAYRNLFEKTEDMIIYHFLTKDKEIRTYRSDKEIKMFHLLVKQVCDSIEQKMFYPRYSVNCSRCNILARCQSLDIRRLQQ